MLAEIDEYDKDYNHYTFGNWPLNANFLQKFKFKASITNDPDHPQCLNQYTHNIKLEFTRDWIWYGILTQGEDNYGF